MRCCLQQPGMGGQKPRGEGWQRVQVDPAGPECVLLLLISLISAHQLPLLFHHDCEMTMNSNESMHAGFVYYSYYLLYPFYLILELEAKT